MIGDESRISFHNVAASLCRLDQFDQTQYGRIAACAIGQALTKDHGFAQGDAFHGDLLRLKVGRQKPSCGRLEPFQRRARGWNRHFEAAQSL
ncbi:hypothetical protein D3C72_2194160 [compost metagenome]